MITYDNIKSYWIFVQYIDLLYYSSTAARNDFPNNQQWRYGNEHVIVEIPRDEVIEFELALRIGSRP